jgi:hypothetical protein
LVSNFKYASNTSLSSHFYRLKSLTNKQLLTLI